MVLRLLVGLLLCTIAHGDIPPMNALLNAKSVKRVKEEGDVVVNARWAGANDEDFTFVNAVEIPARLAFVRAQLLEIPKYKEEQYKKLSSAIQKMAFDPKTSIVEVLGEKGGLRMHSWLKLKEISREELQIDVVRGDLRGMQVVTYLYESNGKTVLLAKGLLAGSRKKMPALVRTLLCPVAEIVIGVATRNFRGYIVEEIHKIKGLTGSYAPKKDKEKGHHLEIRSQQEAAPDGATETPEIFTFS